MKIQPRQQLLEIWQATTRSSLQDGKWIWGSKDRTNSISDAEQLLSIMLPATSMEAFRLDRPNETADDVLSALRGLGDAVEVPQVLIRVITDYMERYTDASGAPSFAGDSYFRCAEDDGDPTAAQAATDVVDSFAMSVTLSLATLSFLRGFAAEVTRESLRREIDHLEEMASKRLSAALIGLLRSFTVNVMDADSAEGQQLIRTANQQGLPQRQVIEALRRALAQVRASLRDITIGVNYDAISSLDNPNRLFECGWSWGIVKDAPWVETTEDVGDQADGVAEAAPYLYFSVVALNAIEDLFSERTRLLGLLHEEQQRLAQELQRRWDLTQQYWSTIASFGDGRWPVEDVPWRTTDGFESDYFSLLVTAVTVQDLANRRATDSDLARVGDVLTELANRARITSRPYHRDHALGLHLPGVELTLGGSEERGPSRLTWLAADFSPLLLKRMLRIAQMMHDSERRGELLRQSDMIWDHLLERRLKDDTGYLWDQPAGAYPQLPMRDEHPSWYYTERVVESLVTAAKLVSSPPLQSPRVSAHADDMLYEAEHLYDQELLGGAGEAGPAMRKALQGMRLTLERARRIRHTRPATAVALISEVLRELDQLTAARRDVTSL
ncbi:SCO2524 family protein [Phytohabitans rumicis]|uniref:Uncharacterized protein n=1 Tax=Phytohabitans rumicis TaxID=1076125 RepID=A0A6V8L6S0_9ACTN|nr:SCO2524 family protein [Phytohabitans rumicis]GFJ92952.1 hypothetical protein Prum_065940 [Phytohabitans rumicis]